jgi:hypothetical protein
MMHMPDIWRAPFDEPALAERIAQLSRESEAASGLGIEGHRRLALTRHPKGLSAAELSGSQRDLLTALMDTYLGRVPPGLTTPADLDTLYLAWAGSMDVGQPHYYRIQGPRLLIEWDNTQHDANHAHSVWRDPQADFGLDVLARHHAVHHTG